MADDPPIDLAALMRAFFPALAPGAAKPPPAAQPTAADSETAQARMMGMALAAANMPSREDVSGLALRLDRMEATLARIEDRMTATEAAKTAKRPKRRER